MQANPGLGQRSQPRESRTRYSFLHGATQLMKKRSDFPQACHYPHFSRQWLTARATSVMFSRRRRACDTKHTDDWLASGELVVQFWRCFKRFSPSDVGNRQALPKSVRSPSLGRKSYAYPNRAARSLPRRRLGRGRTLCTLPFARVMRV